MDPKKMTNLDPKLQEAYNRVMGTALGDNKTQAKPDGTVPASTPPMSSTPPTTPASPPTSSMPSIADLHAEKSSTPVSHALADKPQAPPVAPTPPANQTVSVTMNTPQQSSSSPMGFVASASEPEKKKAKISSGILWVAGFVFFVIYALFWVKFFNFQVPFLPQ